MAFSANAAICEREGKVHFSQGEYIGGVIEFMSESFMKEYHPKVYALAGENLTNVSSVDWDKVGLDRIIEVDCVPLTSILKKAHVRHVNFFILDVEVNYCSSIAT